METSFLDLRCKEVINIVDGRLLGHIVDMVVDIRTSRVTGLVVPGAKSFFSFFKSGQDIFIPYRNICKIGDDVILVELFNLPPVKKCKDNVCSLEVKKDDGEGAVDTPIEPIGMSDSRLKSKIIDEDLEK